MRAGKRIIIALDVFVGTTKSNSYADSNLTHKESGCGNMNIPIFLSATSFCLSLLVVLFGGTSAMAKNSNNMIEASSSDNENRAIKENLVGRYYLAGVMETGSGLQLNPDGSFNWFLTVGGLDIFSGGSWSLDSDAVILLFDPPKEGAAYPPMGKRVLRISGKDLVPDKEIGGTYVRAQSKTPKQ